MSLIHPIVALKLLISQNLYIGNDDIFLRSSFIGMCKSNPNFTFKVEWAEVLVFSDKKANNSHLNLSPISPLHPRLLIIRKRWHLPSQKQGFHGTEVSTSGPWRAGHCPPFDNYNVICDTPPTLLGIS